MRTTLDLDDDVLQAAKDLAAARRSSTGKIISELARKGLEPDRTRAAPPIRNGVPVLPRRSPAAPRPTMRLVNSLRDDM